MAVPALQKPFASYSNIVLSGSGKQGVLKKFPDGSYEIILGALAAYGNGGWIYDENSGRSYIENDREFLAELNGGRLKGEWGHPRREAGMTDQDWFVRINEIREDNTCCAFTKIDLSMDLIKDEKGRRVVGIIGRVKPSGKQAGEFRDMLEDPEQDTPFSIRSFARKDFNTMRKHINKIITWDYVTTPGIAVASKYNTPSLESKQDVKLLLDEAEFNLTSLRGQFINPANDASMESNNHHIALIDRMIEQARVDTKIWVPQSLSW